MPWTLPATVDGLRDSSAFLARATKIMQRHTSAIIESVNELGELGLVQQARAELRFCPVVPLFKLYVINGNEVFFGYYPVQEHAVKLDGQDTAIWDLMGKDTVLFQHTAETDDDTIAAQYVHQSRMWFASVWDTVARPIPSA
jgi:hypothetical protein